MSVLNIIGLILMIAGTLLMALSYKFKRTVEPGQEGTLTWRQIVLIIISVFLFSLGAVLLGYGRPMI